MNNFEDRKSYLLSIGAIEENSLYDEITAEQSSTIRGGISIPTITTMPPRPGSGGSSGATASIGTTVSFDISSYMFALGAGAVFNGGVTSNVVDIAFQKGIFTANQ